MPEASGVVKFIVWDRAKAPLLTETHSCTAETPEAPPGLAGSLNVTETGKVSLVCDVPSELTTWLDGTVVSINHEVESELVPATPFWSWMSAELTVSVYSPWAVVRVDRLPIAYVSPETSVSVTPLPIVTALPSSVRVKASPVRLLVLIGSLKVT